MNFTAFTLLVSLGLFAGMLLLMDLGRRIGASHVAADPKGLEGITAVDGAVFALLGLLVDAAGRPGAQPDDRHHDHAHLAGAMLAGYDMAARKSRSWLHMIGFAAVMATSVYVIIEIEYPRLGAIRMESFDHALVELRANMK